MLVVALAYFLFTLHALFTLEWIGEWARGATFNYVIYYEDISCTIGIISRFIAGLIAIASVIYYFSRGLPAKAKSYRILRWIVVFEGVYWLSLAVNAYFNVLSFGRILSRGGTLTSILNALGLSVIPSVVEAVALPIALFILAYMLRPSVTEPKAVRWSLIVGTLYVFVFWLLNASIWIITVNEPRIGFGYLTSYPQNLVSYIITIGGLLALGIYAAYFTAKNHDADWKSLPLKPVGGIVTSLGMYFLWNYLSYIFFAGKWSDWYAWFLGHNLDLWLLSLPMLGIALMLYNNPLKQKPNNQ
jgi:hypothetical protein